jgi:hypothetical protein
MCWAMTYVTALHRVLRRQKPINTSFPKEQNMKPKTLRIVYWAVTIIFAAFMVFSGIMELSQNEAAQKGMTDLGYPIYLNYIIGVSKLLGAYAILQWRWRTLKEWAYAGFAIDIIGAGASIYFASGNIGMALFVVPFLAVMFWSYYLNKKVNK